MNITSDVKKESLSDEDQKEEGMPILPGSPLLEMLRQGCAFQRRRANQSRAHIHVYTYACS